MTTTADTVTGDLAADVRVGPLVRPDRVHRSVYTDPRIFDREMEVLFGYTWVYVAHESQLPEPNDYVTARLGRRPVIVTRDKDGVVHVLLNRCTHRAATVCRLPEGNAKSFTCPYHGWTFRNDGALTGVPWPDGYAPDFRKQDWGLGVVRTESYRGFIFATLAAEGPSLVEHLGPAAALIDAWLDRLPGTAVRLRSGANRMVFAGNWKLAYDNAADGYHPSFSHRSLLATAKRDGENRDMTYFGGSPDSGPLYVQYLGNGHTFLDQRPAYPTPGSYWDQQRVGPSREAMEAEIRARYPDRATEYLDLTVGGQMNLNIFPNLLIIGNQVQVIEPLAVDSTQLTWWSTTLDGVPDEVNLLRMRHQEDFPSFGEPDDQVNFEEAQRGLAIAEMEWVLFNRGYGIEGRQSLDAAGVPTAPITDELPMRGYFAEWARLMDQEGAA